MILGVVVDFDGTLIDSNAAGQNIFLDLAREFGHPLSLDDSARLAALWGTHWQALLTRFVPTASPDAFITRWRAIERTLSGRFPPHPQARAALQSLRNDGLLVTLHTNRSWKDELSTRLTEADLPRDLFDLIVTAEDGPKKPHPDALRFVLSQLEERYGVFETGAVCVVSDAKEDAIMALACGCPFIGVLTGAAAPEDFAAFGERITVVNAIADVPRTVRNLGAPGRRSRAAFPA